MGRAGVERSETNPGLNVQPNGEGGSLFVAKESLCNPRKEQIEWWKNAPERVHPYDADDFLDAEGNVLYRYERGSRLLIGDETKEKVIEVMDSCQTPWANATVDRAFEELGIKDRPINVLERGFGMGIIATKIIQNLVPRGGTYTVIELNKADADFARREWKPRQLRALTNMARGIRGGTSDPSIIPNITINIIEGDAYEETARLAEAGAKFDIIISDTYPLTEDERGMNDLLDLETLKRCLDPKGVFAFFAHFPGSTEEVAYKQSNLIARHFGEYKTSRATINPPRDYKYLQPDTGPVRSLPVVVCKNPTP